MKTFLIDLVAVALFVTAIVLVLDAADNLIGNFSLSVAEQIAAAGIGVA